MDKKLVQIKNLKTYFYTEAGTAKAVDNISFDIYSGEVLGIVGESGSGKSVTSLSINRLIPNPPGEIVDGEIIYKGENLLGLSYKEMREYRGKDIAMIFQEPMTSLNPVLKIETQMNEVLIKHENLTAEEATARSIDILDADAVRHSVEEAGPDFVFHLAAQSLVRPSYENPLETLSTNAIGPANVLEALRCLETPVVAVMITSDKS
mgnify:CR=1 FL=1